MQLITRICFCLFFAFAAMQFTHALAVASSPVIAPVNEVQIETKQHEVLKPSWKMIWDNARTQARANELLDAQQSYKKLFELKPNIAEAKWEYCKLLMLLKEWDSASQILDGLIEIDPNNIEYLVLAGEVELKKERYTVAVKYYGQVYEESPVGQYHVEAVNGLITAFKGLGKIKSAYLLMEQRFQREKINQNLLSELAVYSQNLGYLDKARFYYSLLVDHFTVDSKTVKNAALVHDYPGFEKEAANYWEKYLTFDENYLPAHQKLSQYYLKLNKAELALPHLIKLYSLDYLSAELALRIGDIYYKNLSRPDKGLFYYEQYIKVFPLDSKVSRLVAEIRTLLAERFLPIVENEGALRLWKDLEQVTINREGLFLIMADLLHNNGKIIHEATLVKIIFDSNKDDLDLGFRLANLYYNVDAYDAAYSVLLLLDSQSFENDLYLILKANTEQRIGEEKKGLFTLLQYLLKNPGNIEVITSAIKMAGNLGLVNELFQIWNNVPEAIQFSDKYIDLGLEYTAALRKNALFTSCYIVYEELSQKAAGDSHTLARIQFDKAESQYQQELVFEAEQTVRQILAKNVAVNKALEKLVRISIAEKQFSWAQSWINQLATRLNVYDNESEGAELPSLIHFLNIDLLIAQEEYDEAEEKLLSQMGNDENDGKSRAESFLYKSELLLIKIDFYSGNFEECQQKIVELLKRQPESDELYVLQDIIRTTSAKQNNTNFAENKLGVEGKYFSRFIRRADLYYQYKSYSKALASVKIAQAQIPESLSAKILEIKILSSLSRYSNALEVVNDIAAVYPDQDYFTRLQLNLEFKSGNFKQIVKTLPLQEDAPVVPSKRNYSRDRDLFFQERLLLARSLWAENRREEAIKVYDSLLAIPVDTVFLEKVEVEKVNFYLPPLKKSFWNMITFTSPAKPDPITTVMDPQFVAQNIGQPVDDIAAGLYGKYRWQKLIKKELAARQAVEVKDFYKAEKEYLSLIKEEKSQETLLDLADIYRRFEEYGKEAELYEVLKERGPLYPGLDEYINSNALKRQPRISPVFSTSNRLGRDGYINLKKRSLGFEGWIMPTLDQEISLGVFRNYYSSYDMVGESESNRFIGSYSTYYEDKFDLNISAGTDRPVGSGTNEILLKFEMMGRFNDSVQGFGRFEQNVVEDTMLSITDSVIYRDLETGLQINLFPRMFVGADYRFRMYSDETKQNYYKLWSMYHLFGEVNQFKLKYSYENVRNTSGNSGEEKVYWSPDKYWQHLITVQFKRLFSTLENPDSQSNYFTLEYSYGYESQDYNSHTFDLNIFLEITRHFLLKGNFINIAGEDFEATDAIISLIYRW